MGCHYSRHASALNFTVYSLVEKMACSLVDRKLNMVFIIYENFRMLHCLKWYNLLEACIKDWVMEFTFTFQKAEYDINLKDSRIIF